MKTKTPLQRKKQAHADPSHVNPSVERNQQKSDETLAVTLDSIADGVISTDVDGRVIHINRVAQKLTGWTLEEAKGRVLDDVFKIINADTGAARRGPFDAAMSSEVGVTLAPNTVLVSRSGEQYTIEDSAAPIRDSRSSEPTGIVLVFRDVTDKKKLEIEFQQAKRLETIGRLAGGIAHDFNNLLAGIIGYSEILLAEPLRDPRLQRYAQSILDTSERAAKLTNQLLAFSRKGKIASVPVDMHARIASVAALLENTIDKRISITTRFHAAAAMVVGDPTSLEGALLNLMLNARDALPGGGAITIETNLVELDQSQITADLLNITPGKYLEISISDTGTGMSEDVKGHLFEPYFTTKGIGRGTGLGLAAVYGTLKSHHGAISLKSVLGRGTTFKLHLPACQQTVQEIKEEDSQVFRGTGCILLVDDEQIVRETTSTMLSTIGYYVLLAKDGAEAIEIYKREGKRIDLVILDVVMPQLSGPDTFFALKNINKDVKVVFSSGYTFDNGANELLSDGVFGFIQKPFRRNALYRVLQECIPDRVSVEQIMNA